MHAVLDEDLRTTLSHLDMEEKAAASALETLMERNGSLIQEIEQGLSTLDEALDQTVTETNIMVTRKHFSPSEQCSLDLFIFLFPVFFISHGASRPGGLEQVWNHFMINNYIYICGAATEFLLSIHPVLLLQRASFSRHSRCNQYQPG